MAFQSNFGKESDRAAVVLIAARLDQLLYQVLSATLRPPPGREDALLDTDRGLGTFASRIDACYRLGLIDAEFCRALHILRRIRNEFAHETSEATLEQPPHRDRVQQMAAPFTSFEKFREDVERRFSKQPTQRAHFSACAMVMVVRLERALFEAKRLEVRDIGLIPTMYKETR